MRVTAPSRRAPLFTDVGAVKAMCKYEINRLGKAIASFGQYGFCLWALLYFLQLCDIAGKACKTLVRKVQNAHAH